MEPIIESGMTFGPYADEDCFYIERSETYAGVQSGVQMAEFLLLRASAGGALDLWIIEAKQSSPQPGNLPKFAGFIGEICEKLSNALALGVASILERHAAAADELPPKFKTLNLGLVKIRLVLVINGHQKSWLPPLQDALRNDLRAIAKTWALDPNGVVVINHEDAKRFNLTTAP